jgi:hypothetical protein
LHNISLLRNISFFLFDIACTQELWHCQVHSLLALADEGHLRRERTALAPGRPVWPLRDAGSEEDEVSQRLAEALLGTAHTSALHLVCVQVRFGTEHEECSFGFLLRRKPHVVGTVCFAHKKFGELKGRARFIYEGQLDTSLWKAHGDVIEEYTTAWGFSARQRRPPAGDSLQEVIYLVRLDTERRLCVQEMAVPKVELGNGIAVESMYCDTEHWLGMPRQEVLHEEHQEPVQEEEEEEEEEEGGLEETLHLEALLRNLSPFCSCLGSRRMSTCEDVCKVDLLVCSREWVRLATPCTVLDRRAESAPTCCSRSSSAAGRLHGVLCSLAVEFLHL